MLGSFGRCFISGYLVYGSTMACTGVVHFNPDTLNGPSQSTNITTCHLCNNIAAAQCWHNNKVLHRLEHLLEWV